MIIDKYTYVNEGGQQILGLRYGTIRVESAQLNEQLLKLALEEAIKDNEKNRSIRNPLFS